MKKLALFAGLAAASALGGCAKDDMYRTEGLSLGAGNALAANTALQIEDPWPTGVEDPNLVTPNSRPPRAGDPVPATPTGTPTPTP